MRDRVLIFSIIAALSLLIGPVSASPSLTIHSPVNGTMYGTDGVHLNVTSDEPADFFTVTKSGRRHYIARNTTSYEAMLYQKAGDYDFTIYANSSGGDGNASVYYSSSVHNPIEIEECGFIQSSDTKYVLKNNVSGASCLEMEELRNASIDLQGFSVYGTDVAISSYLCEQVIVENGTILSDFAPVLMAGVNSLIYRDLDIYSDYYGYYAEEYAGALFENVRFMKKDQEYGITLEYYCDGSNIRMKDSSILIEEIVHGPYADYTAYTKPVFFDRFENVTFLLPDGLGEFYVTCLFSSQCNFEFIDSDFSDAVFEAEDEGKITVTEHSRLDVLTTDQEGTGIPSALEINSLSAFDHNPTRRVLSSTESGGSGKVYLSDKITVYGEGTNNVVLEQSFPSYSVAARSGTAESHGNITFASPAVINFTLALPLAAEYILIDSCSDLESDESYKLKDDMTADQDPCIVIDGASNVIFDLDGHAIDGNGGSAVFINSSSGVEVSNGYIENSYFGIFSKDSSDIAIQDVGISSGSEGVRFEQTSDSIIKDNTIWGNDIGISIISSQDITMLGNSLYNNTENVVIDPSQDIIFIKNMLQAASVGLRLIDILNSVFIGDIITGNNESVILENSSGIDFIRSSVSSASSDFVSIDSSSSLSNVVFDFNKTLQYGDSILYGYFPPYCLLLPEGGGEIEGEECNSTVMYDVNSSLTVSKDSACIIKGGVVVNGSIAVENGRLEIKDSSTILGSLSLEGYNSSIDIKGGSVVEGDITSLGSDGIDIKDSAIYGDIETSGVDVLVIKSSEIGGSIISTNDTNVVIKDNTVSGDIVISGADQCDEKSNDVSGTNSGCS